VSRLSTAFAALRRAKKKALTVFVTAGDPSLKKTEELVIAFEKNGVDVVELGVPFSDPLADGPVIQAASQRALAAGTTLEGILSLVRRIRRRAQLPIVLMGYLNPVLTYGVDRFGRDARAAGVDGLIVPDLPPDEGRDIAARLRRAGIDLIYLLAPTSTPKRRKLVCRASRGFVYYVSLKGVTGARTTLPPGIRENLRAVKKDSRLPVCAGFGISTPEQAKEVAAAADGIIVGSAVVRALAANPKMNADAFARRYVRPFARALGKEV
jgi:tryptophan synthase alpha chain